MQTFLAKQVLTVVSNQTQHEISLERVKVSWLDRASFEQILIFDLAGDTMVYAESVSIDYNLWEVLNGDYLTIDEISSSTIELNLIKHDSLSRLNVSEFINSLKREGSANKDSKPIRIGIVELQNFDLSIDNRTKEKVKGRMDFSHLDFMVDGLSLGQIGLRKDTIEGTVVQFDGVETNIGFDVNSLYTKFQLTSQSLSLDDLDLKTSTSFLSDSLEFYYNGFDDLSHFIDSVSFVFHFNQSKISNEDFQLITGIDKLKGDVSLDGIFWGTVGDFNIEDARIGFGRDTYFEGGISCFGLPDIDQTFILADVTDSHLLPEDLELYVGDVSENLKRMGRIDFMGSFAGFAKDFVARGDFYTDQGSVHSDINIKIPENPKNLSYDGNLILDKVNIGAFLRNDVIQNVNLKANVNGKGITTENADFALKAVMYESGLKGYQYDSVFVDGHFAKNFFKGEFSVDDPNCILKGSAEVDLRTDEEILDLDLDISKLLADRLNLTQNSIAGQGHIDFSVTNFDLDEFTADLKVDSSLLDIYDRKLVLDSIRFHAVLVDSIRLFEYAMPGIEADLKGKFKVSDVLKDIPLMIAGYRNKLQLEDDSVVRVPSGSNYTFDMEIEVGDISPYLDSLKVPVEVFGTNTIEASYRQSKNSNFSLWTELDSIKIKGNSLLAPYVEINGSKNLNSESILTSFLFSSENQMLSGIPDTEGLLLEGVWYDNTIEFETDIRQPSTATDLRVKGNVRLAEDSLTIKMLPSSITIFDDAWSFNTANYITIGKHHIQIADFEIFDEKESIGMSGLISDSAASKVEIKVGDLKMEKANLFTKSSVEGFLNGNFKIFRTLDESYKFEGGFLLKDLTYDDLLLGDINGSSVWDRINNRVYSSVEVNRKDFKAIEAKGYYYPADTAEQLDFDISFDQADLEIGRPFYKENFSNVEGHASGDLKLRGTLASPKLTGVSTISDGALTVNYLNTHYTFSGELEFEESSIVMNGFDFKDRKGSDAFFYGNIYHESFKNFVTDLTVQSSNFEFLNTTSLDNSLYYGSANGSGNIEITGPLNDLIVRATIKTDPDTRLYIPLGETGSSNSEEYIQFVDLSDSTQRVAIEETLGIKGLTLDFDVEVTPDAYCELIFDIKTGDIIRGRGRGNIKLTLNTDGEFSMVGPLEITEGGYNFTFSNILNKEFDVVPGSTITWYGDPYDAQLNLEASYRQRASFALLENPEEQNQDELNNKIPVLAVLLLNGSMLAPEIDFEIRLQEQSDADSRRQAELASINGDEEERRRQAISLLFLRRFSPRQSFALSGGGGSISSGVSEFLSNQFSYLVSQIDENLEVEVNLADLDQDAFNTFQLRFAYTFLGGRLKVTRGGSFGNQESEDDNVLNDIVGDWSVEYSLTKDGRLRAKVFRSSNERLLTNEGQQSHETGVSLRFVHSFDDLADLFTQRRQEGIRRREEESTPSSSQNNDPTTYR